MPTTYEPIASTTLSTAAASITFSSIPQTYTDLRIVFLESSSNGATQTLNFNGDFGTSYNNTLFAGNGGTMYNWSDSNVSRIIIDYFVSGGSATIPAFKTIDIFSYTTTRFKSTLYTNSNDQNGSGSNEKGVGIWTGNDAVTSLTLGRASGNYLAGTRATLYGILRA